MIGWKTNRKIITFSVDDYGNVRINSKDARERMNKSGLKILNRFDAYDTLETSEDLNYLFDTLSSVKDRNGKSAVFTAFAVPCNINFEKMAETGYNEYFSELLPSTYEKLSFLQPNAYNNTWFLWKEGIEQKLLQPQFHGREHFNLKVFLEKLKSKDNELITCLQNRSNTSISFTGYNTINYTAAYEFEKFDENYLFDEINKDGLNCFEKVFGYRAVHFNPPGGYENSILHKVLCENGIKYFDTSFIKKEHQGDNKYCFSINYTGKRNIFDQIFLVRNCIFEPTVASNYDWVNLCLSQIDNAFKWKKPAIISSHRVNFCGHINPEIRSNSLKLLRELLKKIIIKWPDVEFLPANKIGDMVLNEK